MTMNFSVVFILLLFFSFFVTKKNWFNPLNILVAILWLSISLLQMQIMNIYKISNWTFIYISICIFSLIFGTFIGYNSIKRKLRREQDSKLFFYITLILSSIAILINFFYLLKSEFSLVGIIANYNDLYSKRIDGFKILLIPYFGSLIYIASSFGGYFLGSKISKNYFLFSFVPLLFVFVESFLNFGRANLLIGILIHSVSFLFSRYRVNGFKIKFKLKGFILIAFFLTTILFVLVTLRNIRGGTENYYLKNENQLIESLYDYGILSPSIIVYFIGPPSVLNATFDSKLIVKDYVPLENTFAPISRIYQGYFNKIVSRYEGKVNIGDLHSNTGTFLKDPLLDFGVFGSILFCLITGFGYGIVYKKYVNGNSIILFSFLSTYLIMGVFVNILRSGQFLLPLFLILTISTFQKIKHQFIKKINNEN